MNEEQTTFLEIDHQPAVATNELPTLKASNEEFGSNKVKILAALGIIAMASYVAYWVQEPTQLKADVLQNDTVAQATLIEKNVDITLYGFEPATLTIEKNTKVTWTNTSSEDQVVIGASKDGDGFTSPLLTTGNTFSFSFDKDGEYEYYSTYNPALKAKITVGTGLAQAPQTTQPTTGTGTTTASDTAAPATETAPTEPTLELPTTETVTSLPSSTEPLPVILNGFPTTNTTLDQIITTTANIETIQTAYLPATEDQSILRGSAYSENLSKTGPEDAIYALGFLAILFLNRKKLLLAFKR